MNDVFVWRGCLLSGTCVFLACVCLFEVEMVCLFLFLCCHREEIFLELSDRDELFHQVIQSPVDQLINYKHSAPQTQASPMPVSGRSRWISLTSGVAAIRSLLRWRSSNVVYQ